MNAGYVVVRKDAVVNSASVRGTTTRRLKMKQTAKSKIIFMLIQIDTGKTCWVFSHSKVL